MAATPLNAHTPLPDRDASGQPRCLEGRSMTPSYAFDHTRDYRAQSLRYPLLPVVTRDTCARAIRQRTRLRQVPQHRSGQAHARRVGPAVGELQGTLSATDGRGTDQQPGDRAGHRAATGASAALGADAQATLPRHQCPRRAVGALTQCSRRIHPSIMLNSTLKKQTRSMEFTLNASILFLMDRQQHIFRSVKNG